MVYLPRGIAPELLISQVKNTMPYLFDAGVSGASDLARFVPAQVVIQVSQGLSNPAVEPLSHFEYFRLCLSSHYLTVATPVPTDVDNQIRQKLWPAQLSLEVALQMADFVLESHHFDFSVVTGRFAHGAVGTPCENKMLSGHLGEWFTVACGAYCALGQYTDPLAQAKRQQLFDEIGDEVRNHSDVFGSLWRAQDGLGALKASAALAHNFGDLDRVMDMWELSVGDPLRLEFYKLGVLPFDSNRKLRHLGRLWVAGELYKSTIDGSSMALENHRHYALRKPKCLRKSPRLMIATGPFFDDWGKQVATVLGAPEGVPSEEIFEVLEVLKSGWERQPKSLGYGRALRGIVDVYPELAPHVAVAGMKLLDDWRSIQNTPQDRFEKRWSTEAIRLMDEIPSRAV